MAYQKINIVPMNNDGLKSITLFVPADSKDEAMLKIKTIISDFTKTKICRMMMAEDGKTPEQFTWNDAIDYIPSKVWNEHNVIVYDIVANTTFVSPDENLTGLKGEDK